MLYGRIFATKSMLLVDQLGYFVVVHVKFTCFLHIQIHFVVQASLWQTCTRIYDSNTRYHSDCVNTVTPSVLHISQIYFIDTFMEVCFSDSNLQSLTAVCMITSVKLLLPSSVHCAWKDTVNLMSSSVIIDIKLITVGLLWWIFFTISETHMA